MEFRQCAVFVILTVLVSLPFAAGAESYLVQDGKPKARIYLPRVFGKGTLLAADELSEYIEKMTGSTVFGAKDGCRSGFCPKSIRKGKSRPMDRKINFRSP